MTSYVALALLTAVPAPLLPPALLIGLGVALLALAFVAYKKDKAK